MTLMTHSSESRWTSPPSGKKGSVKAITADFYKKSDAFLMQHFNEFFVIVTARLSENYSLAKTDGELRIKIDGAQDLAKNKEMFKSRFFGALRIQFDFFLAKQKGKSQHATIETFSEWSLVSDDELEETLCISTITDKANDRFKESLLRLRQRLMSLLDKPQMGQSEIPISPEGLLICLKTVLQSTQLDISQKLLTYGVFENSIIEHLEWLYTDIQQYFINNGMNIPKEEIPKQKKAGIQNGAPRSESEIQIRDEEKERQQLKNRRATDIDRFLNVLHPSSNPETQTTESQYFPLLVDTLNSFKGIICKELRSLQMSAVGSELKRVECSIDELVTAVNRVQRSDIHLRKNKAVNGEWIAVRKEQVQSMLKDQMPSDEHTQRMKGVNQNTLFSIELVGRIFEYMLKDIALPDSIKSLLSHLHTPYIKVAIIDTQFFQDLCHPARVLLERLMQMSARWGRRNDKSRQLVHKKIELVVLRILKEFDTEIILFEELLNDIECYIERRLKIAGEIEHLAVETEKGLEKISLAKTRTKTMVADKRSAYNLPKEAVGILEGPWSDYMTYLFLCYGTDCEPWQRALNVIDDIIFCVLPKGDQIRSEQHVERYRNLEKQLMLGFESRCFNKCIGRVLLDNLRNVFEASFSQKLMAENVPAKVDNKNEASSSAAVETVTTDANNAEMEQARKKLTNIEFNTEFGFFEKSIQQTIKLKLAWYSPLTQQYMFVNERGAKVCTHQIDHLAEGMISGEIKILPKERPFVERALGIILAESRRQQVMA